MVNYDYMCAEDEALLPSELADRMEKANPKTQRCQGMKTDKLDCRVHTDSKTNVLRKFSTRHELYHSILASHYGTGGCKDGLKGPPKWKLKLNQWSVLYLLLDTIKISAGGLIIFPGCGQCILSTGIPFHVCLMASVSPCIRAVIGAWKSSVLCLLLWYGFSNVFSIKVTLLISCQDPQSLAFCTLSATPSLPSLLETQ